MISPIKRAVIPVAGLGSRMLPATKAIPKELLSVYDRPIIEYVVNEAISGGITEIILVTRSGKEAIENHFDANFELEHRLERKGKQTILSMVKDIIPDGVKVISIRQKDALGLGHAVLCAKHLLNNEPFAVLLPDILVLDKNIRGKNYSFDQLIKAWNETGIGQLMVESINANDVESYGIADLGDLSIEAFESVRIQGLVEKPTPEEAPSNLAVLGRYIIPYEVINILENTPIGIGDEIQLTDALDVLLKSDGLNALKTNATTFDCGNKMGLLGANVAVGIKDPKVKKYLKILIEMLDD
mgnify:CR=1 FL=1|tara:strand:+ start:23 stop:919 length:897 start_codon:yes stop_codon:yes gene_type:complete